MKITEGSVIACSFEKRQGWRTPVRFVAVVKEIMPAFGGYDETYLVKVIKVSHKRVFSKDVLVHVYRADIEWVM